MIWLSRLGAGISIFLSAFFASAFGVHIIPNVIPVTPPPSLLASTTTSATAPSPSINDATSSADQTESGATCDPSSITQAPSVATTTVAVNWSSQPITMANPGFVDWDSDGQTVVTYYSVGTVSSGSYAGDRVIMAIVNQEGVYHFVQTATGFALIVKDSDIGGSLNNLDCSNITLDYSTDLSGLTFPSSFTYKAAEFDLENSDDGGDGFDQSDTSYGLNFNITLAPSYNNDVGTATSSLFSTYVGQFALAFTDPVFGPVYTDSGGTDDIHSIYSFNGLYIPAPDGTFRVYEEQFPINYPNDPADGNLGLTLNNGTALTDEYSDADCGCGCGDAAIVVKSFSKTDLTPIGKTSAGDTIYGLANPNDPFLQNLYNEDNPNDDQENPNPPSYSDWLSQTPVFFWYDPIGRLIEFWDQDLSNANGGKCAPVINLYPTATTTVSVQLSIPGGLIKSVPSYGNGWNVLATPSGELTDLATGLRYPYLFWEAGGPDNTPTSGFVVAKHAIPSFLEEKLPELGLSAKESSDFESYWEPKMTVAPYYFVTFLDTAQMNTIAPLTIEPKPDSLIRVLMEFRPLTAPVSVAPETISTPARAGFTVLEWGGTKLSTNHEQ